MTVRIREADLGDADLATIADIVNETAPDDPTSVDEMRWSAAAYPGASRYILEADGRPVGYRFGRPDLRLPAGLRRLLGNDPRAARRPPAGTWDRPPRGRLGAGPGCRQGRPSHPGVGRTAGRHRLPPPSRVPRVRAQQDGPSRACRADRAAPRPARRHLVDDPGRAAGLHRGRTRGRRRDISRTFRAARPRWRPAISTSSGCAMSTGRRSRRRHSSSPSRTRRAGWSAMPTCCSRLRTRAASRGMR